MAHRIPTKDQQRALLEIYNRKNMWPQTYLQFRRTAWFEFAFGDTPPALMIGWCGMVLGIEPDGYTHS